MQTLKNHYDLRTTEGRTQFIHHTTTLINKIPSHITRQLLLEEVAGAARTSITSLQPTPVSRPQPSVSVRSSTLSVAERLGSWLLYAPQLAQNVQIDFTCQAKLPSDLANLRDLLTLMVKQAELGSEELSLIINQWPEGERMVAYLPQLASVPLHQLTSELHDAVQQIQLQLLELEINHYLHRLSQQGLNEDERRYLSDLLRNRTQLQLV